MTNTDVADAERLIARWKGVSASELSTSQSFLIELCELLGVERPHPTPEQDYMFERPLSFHHADGSKAVAEALATVGGDAGGVGQGGGAGGWADWDGAISDMQRDLNPNRSQASRSNYFPAGIVLNQPTDVVASRTKHARRRGNRTDMNPRMSPRHSRHHIQRSYEQQTIPPGDSE